MPAAPFRDTIQKTDETSKIGDFDESGAIMIAGAGPRLEWRPNPEGEERSIEDACRIARRWGVEIPEFVQFFRDDYGLLDDQTTARTTRFEEFDGTMIAWERFFHDETGKIPFLIRGDILRSDEAIVAVIGHEMFELGRLRDAFPEGAPIENWAAETSPGIPGNFHWLAWDHADSLVERMRGGEG